MADNMLGNVPGFDFTNSLRAVAGNGGAADSITDPADYTSIEALRTTLNTFDNITYSNVNLDKMTTNDMVYAVRSIQDPKTIASYMNAQISRTA